MYFIYLEDSNESHAALEARICGDELPTQKTLYMRVQGVYDTLVTGGVWILALGYGLWILSRYGWCRNIKP
jgi:hypothetical protein